MRRRIRLLEMTEEVARPTKRPRVLVACERCKSRRQKCDNLSPACSNCDRASVMCRYSNDAYPSSYVKRLEERVRQLERNLDMDDNANSNQASNYRDNLQNLTAPAHLTSPPSTNSRANAEEQLRSDRLALGLGVLSSCAAAEPHYFGFSAGLSLAHFVQVAIDSGGNSADISLPLLADRPFSNQAPKANATLADPPSFKAGSSYIRAYLALVHPLYPFLNRRRLWELHRSVTKHQGDKDAIHVEKVDLTIMHLVYAVGSRCLHLLGKHGISSAVPEGHFLRAMKNINEDLKFTSTKSIEITLLLAIHSMRSPCGTSVWHLSGLAIRQCIELGLHKQRIIDLQNTKLDQHRKRLFWSAYIFERKTALVLGRPFSLSDDEIDLDLPVNVDDDDDDQNTVENSRYESTGQKRTSLSFHRYHVQVYQIHTQIRLALHQIRKTASKEQVRMTMSNLLDQLDHWRQRAMETFDESSSKELPNPQRPPIDSSDDDAVYSESSSSVRGSQRESLHRPLEVERNELLLEYHKARRSLLQPLMTEGRHNYPFDAADYAACATASGQICHIYRRLHRLSPLPFTLRDLHAVFVAGFTLIYCVCTCPVIYSAERVSDVGACSTVLYVITEQWSSARKYRDAFETISEKMMDSAKKFQQGSDVVSNIASRQSHYGPARKYANKVHDSVFHTASSSSDDTHDGGGSASASRFMRSRPTSVQTPEDNSLSFNHFTPPSSSLMNDISSYGTAPFPNETLGLNTDSDISSIERLLSSEGLDWFTGAVL